MNLNETGRRNLLKLKCDPGAALDAFTAPSGWEMDLHKRIIARRRRYSLPSEAAADETFLKGVHRIVKAWYGNRNWLLINYGEDFRFEVRRAASKLDDLAKMRIETLQDNCTCPHQVMSSTKGISGDRIHTVEGVAERLWYVISNFEVTIRTAKIVSGTKVIHHLIPNLLPPMDNLYTANFFLGHGFTQSEQSDFKKAYLAFADLSQTFRGNRGLMKKVGENYNTSLPKTMDHAIIGYMSKLTASHGIC